MPAPIRLSSTTMCHLNEPSRIRCHKTWLDQRQSFAASLLLHRSTSCSCWTPACKNYCFPKTGRYKRQRQQLLNT